MKIQSTTATVLIYTIILVNISLLMAIVILNNSSLLSSSKDTENFATKLINNITDTANINLKLHKTLNSNGSGFIDNIACPNDIDMAGTLSGSTNSATGIVTQLVFTGSTAYCVGDYLIPDDIKIYFNNELSDITLAEYESPGGLEFLNVSSGSLSGVFGDTDQTQITIQGTGSYMRGDDIDDDFNSDDYKVSSTGSQNYPNGYGDDDTDVRKTIYGYVSPDAGYTKIFWSNEKTNNYIDDNTNNTGSINVRASTSSGFLVLDADKSFDIKILELDRSGYSNLNEIRAIVTTDYSVSTGLIGHIQTDGNLDSGNADGYEFDFPNKDYAVFLNNTGSGVLFYTLSGEALSGSGLYINPIIDDEPDIIRVLGNDILINEQGLYVGKQSEVVTSK